MNQPALPAYLQNRNTRRLVDDATAGLGTSLPAHISTQGSVFTLVDAAGNEHRLTFKAENGQMYQQPYLDACVIDLNRAISKRYYGGKKWTPGANDAPLCWSANGDAPSNESAQKQARTCAECKWNERGSATSEKSGASIKACRDEKWLALLIPQINMDTVFRYVITPGSFANWKAYSEMFKRTTVDVSEIITRFEFDPAEPNTIKFSSTGQYIDEQTAQTIDRALAAKATDAIVGRDQAVAQLAAPAPQAALPPAAVQAEPAPFVPAPQPVQPAASPSFQTTAPDLATASPPATASPSEAPAPGRRRRNAAPAAPAPGQQNLPLQAPFPVGNPPGATPTNAAAPQPTFGIQAGVAPDPALSAMLAGIFPRGRQ